MDSETIYNTAQYYRWNYNNGYRGVIYPEPVQLELFDLEEQDETSTSYNT